MKSAIKYKVRTLLVLFTQVINKHLRMNGSINLESLTDVSTLRAAKCRLKKKNRYLDKFTV